MILKAHFKLMAKKSLSSNFGTKIFWTNPYGLVNITRIKHFKYSDGALVFWRPGNPSSLDAVPKWMTDIKKVYPSLPCVLITDSTPEEPLQWIGPGKIFESEFALDQFCKEQGFVDHFEITSCDWESGEKSVFGQAVNCLLNEIFKNQDST